MKKQIGLGFQLSRTDNTPLFAQLCEAIRQQAISGVLLPGEMLPPSRALAVELGVSRSTVMIAYEQLIAEGYLQSRQGAGYRLTDIGSVELKAVAKLKEKPETTECRTTSKESMKHRAAQTDMQLFPHQQWAKTIARICRNAPHRLLEGGDVFGSLELRCAIVNHLAQWRAMNVRAEQVIITAGATDALELCVRALCQYGDIVNLETPGYPPLRQLVAAMGMNINFMPIDQHGAALPANANSSMVVVTPSHQYPLGGAMSAQRRHQFIKWAQQTNRWLIEDDYDSEFRYAGQPIPALASLDTQRTLYIGSFSKVFSSHLRLGYLVLPCALCDTFKQLLNIFAPKASYLPQAALADYIDGGAFYRHLRRVRRVYDERRAYLADSLQRRFSDFGEVNDFQAGMHLVFILHALFDDRQVASEMAGLGFDVTALSSFYAGNGGKNGLVMGYSGVDSRQMDRQLVGLHKLLQKLMFSNAHCAVKNRE